MAISVEQVDIWRALPKEHQRLEFKEARNQYDTTKLCAYCVAIANEGGGNLLLGIEDRMPRNVIGSHAFPYPNDIGEKLFAWLHFRIDVEAVLHPNGRVLVFTIPSRPRGTAYHHDGRYLMRSGEELVSMTEDRLRTIFDEGKPDWLEQNSATGLTPADVIELLDTQAYFELRGLAYPTNQAGVIERLQSDRLIKKDEHGISMKRVGSILLAKRLSDFDDLDGKAPRVIVYSGSSKLSTRLDKPGEKGYAVGFRNLVQFAMSHLPGNEVIREALREDHKLVPDIVVRELIANALVHQDFSISGAAVMIEIYENRLEISNPGEPIIPSERFIDGSRSRNTTLAILSRRMGICEEKGSGIDKVVSAIEAWQLPAPEFVNTFGRTMVIVHGPQSFDLMTRADRLRACYQHATLKYVMRGEYMNNRSLRERFGLPEDKGTIISQLILAGTQEKLIKLDSSVGDSKRLARYLPYWA